MALMVRGDLEERQLDLAESVLARISFSSFSPDCLYNVECKIVPFGCLF